jgi:hypothetical protein
MTQEWETYIQTFKELRLYPSESIVNFSKERASIADIIKEKELQEPQELTEEEEEEEAQLQQYIEICKDYIQVAQGRLNALSEVKDFNLLKLIVSQSIDLANQFMQSTLTPEMLETKELTELITKTEISLKKATEKNIAEIYKNVTELLSTVIKISEKIIASFQSQLEAENE